MDIGRFLTEWTDFRVEWKNPECLSLLSPLRYAAADGTEYEVPPGLDTDLASVPRIFRALVPSWRQTARAGVLHDYLYREGARPPTSRRRADSVFREALRSDGASGWDAFKMWVAVRIGGRSAYHRKSVPSPPAPA